MNTFKDAVLRGCLFVNAPVEPSGPVLDKYHNIRNLEGVRTLILCAMLCAAAYLHAAGWPFVPLTAPPIPSNSSNPGSHPIDCFIQDQLAASGLAMNPTAFPRELIRRAYYDLIGLPPTYEEVQQFEQNPTDQHWNNIIQDLLKRPQYGERWASHWLDIVRFAETNGYERDGPKPEAWRYRDYVIQSLNTDKPYDQFIREQLAGDLLYPESRQALVATGFYRLHVYDDEPDDALKADYDTLDDILSTIGSAFLGVTVNCARCHDHKFDPMSQAEYYALLDFIHRIEPYGRPHTGGGSRPYGAITRPLATHSEISQWKERQEKDIRALEEKINSTSVSDQESIARKLEELKKQTPPFENVLAISDATPKEDWSTHRLQRGDPRLKGEKVTARIPTMLSTKTSDSRGDSRADLASWASSSDNPMTARVIANRIWQYHFGRGIVATPNDFGAAGSGATHPDLLDHLAAHLIQSGWSLKELHRYIMTSKTYRMSSRAQQPSALLKDPSNQLFWRQELRRMDAEVLRDSMLLFSGDLNLKPSGPGIYPELPAEVHRTQDSARKGWGESSLEDQNRRSIYIYAKRALPLPLLEVFDASHVSFSLGRRPVTTVAPQALTLLNDAFMQDRAARLAYQTSSMNELFKILWQRLPSDDEYKACEAMLKDQTELLRSDGNQQAEEQAWAHLCLAMLNANESIMID